MSNCKMFNGTKLCPGCSAYKPLSEYPIKWKYQSDGTKKPSYGKCQMCTLQYDQLRRRTKGMPVRVITERAPKQKKIVHDIKAVCRMKAVRYHRSKNPHVTHKCRECNMSFEAARNRVFCTPVCSHRHYHRLARRKERARMRTVKVDQVNPVVVFELYNWHCALCNVHTPSYLKGKHADNSPELDHIRPLSKGGAHEYNNVQLLCRRCNHIKSNHYIECVTA